MTFQSLFWWLIRPFFPLNYLLQIKQVNSENDDSDDNPLALALLSLCFLSASQTLFAIVSDNQTETSTCELSVLKTTGD